MAVLGMDVFRLFFLVAAMLAFGFGLFETIEHQTYAGGVHRVG